MTFFSNFLANLPFMTPERADILISSFLPMLKATIYYTIPLAVASFILGTLIGLLVAVIRTNPQQNPLMKALKGICRAYISIIRGTPLLVQIMIIFYALPDIGIKLEPLPTVIIAFSISIGAYTSEAIRAAILSIPQGQWEASYAIGMSYQRAFIRTIMPQAMRVSVPSLGNTFISTIKDTSLASVVMITELFRVAQNITAREYEFILIYTQAALIYWIVCVVMSVAQERLEKRLSRHL